MGLTHLRALSRSQNVCVSAVTDPAERVRQALKAHDVAVYGEVESMLQAEKLDGVLVAAPSARHLALVDLLTAAGLPVLCEKPCGITADDARQAATLASKRDIPLQIAYWRRFVPELRLLRERIVAADLGELYFLACLQWDELPPPPAFRSGSGGIFVDMGVHEFDQIRWLSGQEIVEIHTCIAEVSGELRVPGDPENAQVLCKLSGGSTALVSLGQRFRNGTSPTASRSSWHSARWAASTWRLG